MTTDKLKKRKVICDKCHGVGHHMSTYGMKACELCNTKGYFWVTVRKYTRKPKVIAPIKIAAPKLEFYNTNLKEFLAFANKLKNKNIMVNQAFKKFRTHKEKQ